VIPKTIVAGSALQATSHDQKSQIPRTIAKIHVRQEYSHALREM
jgi:hypothetical protein